MAQDSPTMKAGTLSQQIHERLATLERRDWELWVLAIAMVGILGTGYLLVLYPSIAHSDKTVFSSLDNSSILLIGQFALVMLFLVYIVHKRIQIRSLRSQSVMDAMTYQLSHAQLLIDPLTQAFNRTALEEVIGKEIKRVERGQSSMVLVYVDVDNLKHINTKYGHLSGDLVLTEAGAILKGCVRGSDYVIRMGGDEFLAVLVDTDMIGAEVVKQRIEMRASRWSDHSPLEGFRLTMSVGLKEFDGSRSFDEVLADADSEMYVEKQMHTMSRAGR